MVGTARCAVTARKARGIFAVERPTTLVAPLNAARTAVAAPLAKSAVPTRDACITTVSLAHHCADRFANAQQ